ncbi:unnamed protein product [Strongylus vulgaris]|uniref:Uncharacterized protein n=1 Tax=Strongylus vulgaris TaxID=40348 RepID=A0A3P7L8C9_STRVU|nr:unnamed protein product [Strongylus vulgaris]
MADSEHEDVRKHEFRMREYVSNSQVVDDSIANDDKLDPGQPKLLDVNYNTISDRFTVAISATEVDWKTPLPQKLWRCSTSQSCDFGRNQLISLCSLPHYH